jgi:hypothetical protein
VRVKARRVTFTPVAGWLTASTSERVEGWPCSLWEAGADLVAVNTSKAHLALPPGATWGDYLAAHYKVRRQRRRGGQGGEWRGQGARGFTRCTWPCKVTQAADQRWITCHIHVCAAADGLGEAVAALCQQGVLGRAWQQVLCCC